MIKKTLYIDDKNNKKVEKLAMRHKKLTESYIVRFALNTLDEKALLKAHDDYQKILLSK